MQRTHPRGVNRLVATVTLGLIAVAAVAVADAIQKWRTPGGSLYFGDRPPSGSTLLDTYPDTPALPATVVSSDLAAFSQAAADGRDIIRRREVAREAERQADAVREARIAEIEASQVDAYTSAPFWFTTGTVSPCRFGAPCGHDHFRFPRQQARHDVRFHNQFFPSVVPPFRPAPAPPPAARRSFQMSARLGRPN
jgi:hypothetical protein